MNNKILKASYWAIGGVVFSQFVRLFGNLILTRLLLPEMFALMTIVTSIRVGVYMCSEIGLKMNVIRHKDGDTPVFLQTAWTLQVIRGALLWGVITLLSVALGFIGELGFFIPTSVYSDESLPKLLVVIGFVSFILGFESSRTWVAQRQLNLKGITSIELIAQFMGAVVMVAWAWFFPSVWALVGGSIVSAFCRVVMSHLLLKGDNDAFRLDRKVLKELITFGKWLFLSAIITFFALNGDRLILGGFLSTNELGIYSIAFFLATAVRDLLINLVSKVWYPMLSEINREAPDKLKDTYYKLRVKQDIVIFFIVGFLYSTAPLIVEILYDERYLSAGWMMQILVISLVASAFNVSNILLMTLGFTHYGTILVSVRAISLWVGVPMLYFRFGIEGSIWGGVFSSLVVIPFTLFFLYRKKILIWYKEIWMIFFVFIGYFIGETLLLIKESELLEFIWHLICVGLLGLVT